VIDTKRSSPNVCPAKAVPVTVMVRAYEDEPVKLHMLSVGRNCVEVAGQDTSKPMGFPPEFVYQVDESLFELLRAAFTNNAVDELTELWSQAKRLPAHG